MQLKENKKLCVALLCGGQSTEYEVSLRSSINIIQSINRKKYKLLLIGINKDGQWALCDEDSYLINRENPMNIRLAPFLHPLAFIPGYPKTRLVDTTNGRSLPSIDVVFSTLHGTNGENGSVQGLLKVLNIPYAGSGVLGSAICMDKDMTKRVLRGMGLAVTPSITLRRMRDKIPDFNSIIKRLGVPLFIKPASQGSSIGVSKVDNQDSFQSALTLAFSYDTKVLVEKAIIGREVETAILGNDFPKVSVCGEILNSNEFYTYDTKYLNTFQTELIVPAKLPRSVTSSIQQMAKKAYLALECSVMARIDFFLTRQGDILVNEVNTLPGFTSDSMYSKLWEVSGIDSSSLIDRLIKLALLV